MSQLIQKPAILHYAVRNILRINTRNFTKHDEQLDICDGQTLSPLRGYETNIKTENKDRHSLNVTWVRVPQGMISVRRTLTKTGI